MGNELITKQLTSFVENINFSFILPQILLTVGALLLMIMAAFIKEDKNDNSKGRSNLNSIISVLFLLIAGVGQFLLIYAPANKNVSFSGMVVLDPFSSLLNILYIIIGLLITLIAHGYFVKRGKYVQEFYSLLLFAIVGMMFMTMANDLIVLFIGLEILSISLYILAGLDVHHEGSNESAFKYFLMGSFSSGFILYGIALLYGATGSTALPQISQFIAANGIKATILVPMGIVLILVGLGFKVSMVPFHMWTPDVYQGAPLVITAFMSTAPKAAAFGALLKAIFIIMPPSIEMYGWLKIILVVLSIATMTIGNFMALNQTDIKRMLAFSSIAHVGYMMIALAVFSAQSVSSILFYLTSYAFMNLGLFGILAWLAKDKDTNLTLEGIQGLGKRRPILGLIMVLFLFSLAGIPPTAGFTAKFFIFSAAIEGSCYLLAIVGILNSAVSGYYYLRVILYAYMKDGEAEIEPPVKMGFALTVTIAVTLTGVFYLGLLPKFLMDWSAGSISLLK